MAKQQKNHFPLLGGHPAIDLVNTEVMREGVMTDLLASEDALADWLRAAGLLSIRARGTRSALLAAREMRSAMRRIATDVSSGESPKRGDLAVIERELRRVKGSLALHRHGRRLSFGFEPAAADVRFIIASALAAFLAELEGERLRACGGARCILFFYDTSKSGTRRWCTMAGCGNRAKAATHYRRIR